MCAMLRPVCQAVHWSLRELLIGVSWRMNTIISSQVGAHEDDGWWGCSPEGASSCFPLFSILSLCLPRVVQSHYNSLPSQSELVWAWKSFSLLASKRHKQTILTHSLLSYSLLPFFFCQVCKTNTQVQMYSYITPLFMAEYVCIIC